MTDNFKMGLMRGMHKLTNHTNDISNARAITSKINQIPN